ncbi:hypothetical protein SteCoe_31435 [Stentor coeruleus]|uniref:Uncharacterized protein n=1 Tax=Stentor coeruleus TaxID=5963 RepID=A0A1R2B1A4_9CILI|nr:hypothetical protein SteCoe_31435 [Stentor coeruleus]
MEIEIDPKNLEKAIQELFTYAYMTNTSLDDENFLVDDSNSIDHLSSFELKENFKTLIMDLLKFKKQRKNTKKAELVLRNSQFEALNQKLDSEIKNHKKNELKLESDIENYQNFIKQLEISELKDNVLIEELDEKCNRKKNPKSSEIDKIRKEMEEKIRSLLEAGEKKDKALRKIEYENIKLKTLLEEKTREFDSIKKELLKINKMTPAKKTPYFRSQTFKKNHELSTSRKLLERSESLKEYFHTKRNSVGELDLESHKSLHIKKDSNEPKSTDILPHGQFKRFSEKQLGLSRKSNN